MKSFLLKAGATAVLGFCVITLGWSQNGGGAAAQEQAKPGTPAAAPTPQPSKQEVTAYNKYLADEKVANDPRQRVTLGETFVTAFPNSMYAGAVWGRLSMDYMSVNDVDKMMSAGEKALAADPNNIDVLPMMAFAIPRRNGATAPQLEAAMNYGRRAINILGAMPKPADLDEATFTKVKNQKLAECRSGMGTAYFKTGRYDEAVTELSQAVKLDADPDPVDFYILGLANDRASHFTDAVAAFDKCATLPSALQANCKNLSAETKKKAANSLEAPK